MDGSVMLMGVKGPMSAYRKEGAPALNVLNVSATNVGTCDGDLLDLVITFDRPIPPGFTRADFDICTFSPGVRCWDQGSQFEVQPGQRSITIRGACLNHSLRFNEANPAQGEHGLLRLNNPTTGRTIELRFDVNNPGDF